MPTRGQRSGTTGPGCDWTGTQPIVVPVRSAAGSPSASGPAGLGPGPIYEVMNGRHRAHPRCGCLGLPVVMYQTVMVLTVSLGPTRTASTGPTKGAGGRARS